MKIDRRTFGRAALGAGTLALAGTGSFAAKGATPDTTTAAPLPAAHRFALGDFTITALSDGFLNLGLDLFPAADPAAAEALLTRAFLPKTIATSVNAYLVTRGSRRILIDTGTASAMGPTLGHLPEALVAAGVKREEIDTVIVTHLHPDHANGLIGAGGEAAFPAAEIVVANVEFAFWHDDGILSQAPDPMRPFFEMARKSLGPYRGKIRQMGGEVEIAPGIAAVPAPGHTPGHLALRIGSGDANMLLFTDVIHSSTLQFAHPEWAIAFDVDQAAAVATRKKVLDMVSADRLLVAGMHLPFPGVGHVTREGNAYSYIPMPWPAL
ncbi:MBL fold metallo-hydrolase [Bradyrhizobium hipponense]|uniref:MBL fold metallo-hydrolase n=1 Tax=Bradyrhizobium hipponense TaxID=2605638 RepID=A0A5S4YU78_9BRAD|nr:MBL fold metallo-hydrolase [Bradyrhizobium hipponense]TYO67940.1 MBL fold metallo-hydrolase [Bradyrhizobium hipponense]